MTSILFLLFVILIAVFLVKWGLKKIGVTNKTSRLIIAIPLALVIGIILYFLITLALVALFDDGQTDFF